MDLMNGNLLEEEPRFNIRPRPIDVSIQMPVLQLDKICEICLSEEPTDMTCEGIFFFFSLVYYSIFFIL